MNHDEFVTAYRSGQIQYAVPAAAACRYMETSLVPKGDAIAYATWNWIAILTPIIGLALGFFFSWWFLLLVMAMPVIWSSNKKTATQVVLNELLRNPQLYHHALQSGYLHIQ